MRGSALSLSHHFGDGGVSVVSVCRFGGAWCRLLLNVCCCAFYQANSVYVLGTLTGAHSAIGETKRLTRYRCRALPLSPNGGALLCALNHSRIASAVSRDTLDAIASAVASVSAVTLSSAVAGFLRGGVGGGRSRPVALTA